MTGKYDITPTYVVLNQNQPVTDQELRRLVSDLRPGTAVVVTDHEEDNYLLNCLTYEPAVTILFCRHLSELNQLVERLRAAGFDMSVVLGGTFELSGKYELDADRQVLRERAKLCHAEEALAFRESSTKPNDARHAERLRKEIRILRTFWSPPATKRAAVKAWCAKNLTVAVDLKSKDLTW
jgi:hypothetical protein